MAEEKLPSLAQSSAKEYLASASEGFFLIAF
jgi:hypothetical protein